MNVSDATLIDLASYVQTGEGANGLSYDSLADPDEMVKMYNAGYDTSTIITELEVARKVWRLGIPSPKPGELVTDGSRIGIRFRRIRGKRSFARAMSQEPERVPELVREFARHCKALHATQSPDGMFPDAKTDFLRLLEADTFLEVSQKETMARFIRQGVPECGTALHGDMHFGNVLTTLPAGAPMTDPHDVYFIDLGYFSRGCPLLDLGMTWNICNLADDDFVQHDFHFGRDTARLAWKIFSDEYFFGPDCQAERWFGPGADADTVYEALKPYVCVKLLLVEYNIGSMPEGYRKFVLDTLPSMK